MSDRRFQSGAVAFFGAALIFPFVTNAIVNESHKGLPNGSDGNMFDLGHNLSPGAEAAIYIASIIALTAILYCVIRTLDQLKTDADGHSVRTFGVQALSEDKDLAQP